MFRGEYHFSFCHVRFEMLIRQLCVQHTSQGDKSGLEI